MSEFSDVVDTRTGAKQRVPTEWLTHPIHGRFINKTPSQRALDGELGQAPSDDSTVTDIRAFAKDADIDVSGLTKKADLLDAVRAVIGTEPLPEPAADAGVSVESDLPGTDLDTPAGAPPASTTDESPAPGAEE